MKTELKTIELVDEKGKAIKGIINIMSYLDGWVVLNDKGTIYSNIEMFRKHIKKCEKNGMVYTSFPAQYKCINCGRFWSEDNETPNCILDNQK